jgi:hypothetical protein
MLLKNKADPNLKDQNQLTALKIGPYILFIINII